MKAKAIFIKTLSMFFVVYLVIMMIFSSYIVKEERVKNRESFTTTALQVSNNIWKVIQKYSNDENEIIDIASLKKEILYQYLGNDAMEFALFDSDYQLIYNTSDDWVVSYNARLPETSSSTQFGYLSPEDWFTKEDVLKMEALLYDNPQVKKVGDTIQYYLQLEGFWVDGTTIIPEIIKVVESRAASIDENGNVISSVITESSRDYVFKANFDNPEDLPYYTSGSIEKGPGIAYSDGNEIILRNDESQRNIREIVLDVNRLKAFVEHDEGVMQKYQEMEIGELKQQEYAVITYDSSYSIDKLYDRSYTIDNTEVGRKKYYVVFANESSAFHSAADTLIPIWISSFIIFMLAAAVLAYSNYKTYKKKEAMDKQHRELTNALAHELKTPLAIISGYSENLKESIHTEKREYYASKIQDKTIYMDGIIREMLELSRLEAGNLMLNKEELSLKELSQEVYNRYAVVINEKNINFTIEGDSIIFGDKNLILKVIDNFLINAVSFTEKNGVIEITISNRLFEIYNSGSHIPEDKIDDIWKAYNKGDDSSRSISKGTGLGLYIAAEILKLHKLTYGASNTRDGMKFWFSI